jgi:hypothetical protein
MSAALATDVLAASGIVPVRMGTDMETHGRAPAETAAMTSRITQTVVHFSSAFLLPGSMRRMHPGTACRLGGRSMVS